MMMVEKVYCCCKKKSYCIKFDVMQYSQSTKPQHLSHPLATVCLKTCMHLYPLSLYNGGLWHLKQKIFYTQRRDAVE